MPGIPDEQTPLAAYAKNGAWMVLTAKQLTLEAYVAALNAALQALFGMAGVQATPRRRP